MLYKLQSRPIIAKTAIMYVLYYLMGQIYANNDIAFGAEPIWHVD
jgi:hypothetical protein